MAFNFYGTFTTGQFNLFIYFSKLQEQDLKKRINFVNTQLTKVGVFITEYGDDYLPISYTVQPSNSYAAKLLLAYKILGGKPEEEMLLRTRDLPVYLTTGTPISTDIEDGDGGKSEEYSNGRRARGGQRFDRDVGIQVNKIKNWQLEVIKRKRESLEFKIKRALDYSDQLTMERDMLNLMVNDSEKSLDFLVGNATGYMFKSGAMNIVQNMFDIFGLRVGKPVDIMVAEDVRSADATGGRSLGGSVDQEVSNTKASNPLA